LLIANVWATQYIARHFEYQDELGQPLLDFLHVKLYQPFSWVSWVWTYGRSVDPAVRNPLLLAAFMVVVGAFLSGAVFFVLNLRRAKQLSRNTEDLHGSAGFANEEEIRATRLLDNEQGVYVGGWYNERARHLHYLRHNGPEHVLAFAPTRMGKGVALVIPTLLAWSESIIVYDIKGDNWVRTAGFREHIGQTCLRFCPVEETPICRFNPLEEVRIGTLREVSDAQNLAEMIVNNGEQRSLEDPHWENTAKSLVTGMILHVCYAALLEERVPTLAGISDLLTRPGTLFNETLQELLSYPHDPTRQYQWRLPSGESSATHPTVRQKAQEMLNKADKEFSGVLSCATTALTLFSDPLVARSTAKSDFRILDLVEAEKPVSLYIVVPPSEMARLRPLTRLICTLMVNRLTERIEYDGALQKHPKHRLLFLIDEFPTLKKMDIFAGALAYMAGFGLKAYLITQDIRQIVAEYGMNESIVSNCGVRVAFTPNQYETAELLSKMTGNKTIQKASFSYSGSRGSTILSHINESVEQIQRPLMTPDEILRLPAPRKEGDGDKERIVEPGDMLIFAAGHRPIYGKQMLYFLDDVLRARAELPPPQPPRVGESPARSVIASDTQSTDHSNRTDSHVTAGGFHPEDMAAESFGDPDYDAKQSILGPFPPNPSEMGHGQLREDR
jgi:type IV secretion system protein VirD4